MEKILMRPIEEVQRIHGIFLNSASVLEQRLFAIERELPIKQLEHNPALVATMSEEQRGKLIQYSVLQKSFFKATTACEILNFILDEQLDFNTYFKVGQ
ncbi:MAG: hypothetical protein JNL36_07665 [Candidatus Kapabacteria bacterium]|nr:hypothetical protein [Candidatus Kapabacteria bacterium]